MIRRILAGVAGTPATDAKIAYTVELAARHRAAEYVRAYGAEVTTTVIDTPVLEGIPAEAERVGADLLVLGTHYRKAILGKRFGSTILATLKASERPILMTH